MSNQIVIEYTRREAAYGGYYLYVRVRPGTFPDELEPCLVYSRASDDQLVRVASLAEITSISEDTNEYAYFKSPAVATPVVISAGDTLEVTSAPSLWNEIGYTVPKVYRIEERIVDAGPTYYLRIVPDGTYPDYFPAYAEDVSFTIHHAGGTTSDIDGVVQRRLDSVGVNNYRVKEQYNLFDDVTFAGFILTNLETQAQNLIDEYNDSEWVSETFEETYE